MLEAWLSGLGKQPRVEAALEAQRLATGPLAAEKRRLQQS